MLVSLVHIGNLGCSAEGAPVGVSTHDSLAGLDGNHVDGGSNEPPLDGAADGASTLPVHCGLPTGERPARRSEHTGAFDAEGKRLVLFGGSFGVPQNCGYPVPTFETETWVYDVTCRRWRESKAVGPAGRARAASAWVPGVGLTVFGGRSRVAKSGNYDLHGDLWAFDPDADKWTQLAKASGIPARFNTTLIYASGFGKLLVFGGNTSGSAMNYVANNDVWQYRLDAGVWSVLKTSGTPPPKRFFASAVWDAARKRMVVFGGADESLFSNTAKYRSDLWVLDFSGDTPTWSQLPAGPMKPAGRFWAGLAVDPIHDAYVLFAGHDDGKQGNRNDLWSYKIAEKSWSPLRLADTYNKPANGFCSFPPDFTNLDVDAPERRNGGVVTGGLGGLWVQGGKTDCGVIDDLFRYDYESGAWQELTAATVGEACLRKGGVGCNDYCF